VGNVDEFPGVDLGMAFCDPGIEFLVAQAWMTVQLAVDGGDGEVQEVCFVIRIALPAGEDYPVRAAGSQDFRSACGRPCMLCVVRTFSYIFRCAGSGCIPLSVIIHSFVSSQSRASGMFT